MAGKVKPEATFINEELQHLNDDLALCKTAPKPLDRAFSSGEYEIPERAILQVVSVENVAVPKKDQNFDGLESSFKKKLLKVTLTDGSSSCDALLIEPHTNLREDTIPGTKVRILRKTKLNRRMFIVSGGSKEVEVLGGVVPALKEKWLHSRTRNPVDGWSYVPKDGKDGPPVWRPFGYKSSIVVDKNFRTAKAMDLLKTDGDEEKKDGGVFEAQRKEAISELAKVGPKKFGAGKQLLEKELVYLMEKGFNLNESTEAFNRFKNTQKALKHLQMAHGIEVPVKPVEDKPEKKAKKKGRRRDEEEDDYDDGEVPVHRANNISLFGFISQQMNLADDSAEPIPPPEPERDSYQRYDNRGRGRGGRGDRGYRGGDRGGRGGDRGGRGGDRGGRGGDRGGRGGDRGERGGRFQTPRYDNRQEEETLFQVPRSSHSRGNDQGSYNDRRYEQKPFDPSGHNFPQPNWSEGSNGSGSGFGRSGNSRNDYQQQSSDFNRSADYRQGSGYTRGSDYNSGTGYNRGSDYSRDSGNSRGTDYNRGSGYRGGSGYSRGSDYNHTENRGSGFSRGSDYNSGMENRGSSGYSRGSDYRRGSDYSRGSDRGSGYNRGRGNYENPEREYSKAPSEAMSSFRNPQPPQQPYESVGDYERKPNYSTTYYNSSRRGGR